MHQRALFGYYTSHACDATSWNNYCTVSIGEDTCDPAMMTLQLCYMYSDIKTALDTHITVVASSCCLKCLVPAEVHSTIVSSLSMPSGDKANMFLNAIEN